jgi:hypothetical protein
MSRKHQRGRLIGTVEKAKIGFFARRTPVHYPAQAARAVVQGYCLEMSIEANALDPTQPGAAQAARDVFSLYPLEKLPILFNQFEWRQEVPFLVIEDQIAPTAV